MYQESVKHAIGVCNNTLDVMLGCNACCLCHALLTFSLATAVALLHARSRPQNA